MTVARRASRACRRDVCSPDTSRGVLTAFESPDFPVVEAYRLGAVDYLVKPLVPEILRAKVAGFVELFQRTEQVRRQAERLRHLERQQFERETEERFRTVVESVKEHA